MSAIFDAIVIGGGQAGLASGYYLKKNELQFLILEASEQATSSWPHYYDSLKLFSPSRLSSLPGMKIPGTATHYPLRNEVIQYLKSYAQRFDYRSGPTRRLLPWRKANTVLRSERQQETNMRRERSSMRQAPFIIPIRRTSVEGKSFKGKSSTLPCTAIRIVSGTNEWSSSGAEIQRFKLR